MDNFNFMLFIAAIVLIFLLIKANNQINDLKKQIMFLDSKIRDLYDKSFYNYEQIKNLSQNQQTQLDQPPDINENNNLNDVIENQPLASNTRHHVVYWRQTPVSDNLQIQDSQQINAAENVQAETVQQTNAEENVQTEAVKQNNVTDNVQTEAVQQTNAAENIEAEAVQQSDNAENIEAEAAQQTNAAEYVEAKTQQNVPINNNSYNPYQQLIPGAVNVQNPNNQAASMDRPFDLHAENSNKEPKQFKSFESWLGTRLYNIMASLMIFIGLVLFCTLGYEYITNEMKMAAMFLVSGSFIGLGAYFTRKNKSVFSLGLTGCGFGTFFISILLSHIYFQAISDTTAFILLTAWSALALFMSGKLDSMMLSVTAHMGTAVSICFAFSVGMSKERIMIPVIYQLAAIAVIVVGNLFFCKKTYRFGLFMSEALLIYTSMVMCAVFSGKNSVSPYLIVLIFAMQIAAVSVISHLISQSTSLLAEQKSSHDIMIMAHMMNKILWSLGMVSSVGYASSIVLRIVYHTDSLVIPAFAVCAASLIHIISSLSFGLKKVHTKYLAYLSVWVNSVIIMIALEIQSSVRVIFKGTPFIFIFVFILLLIVHITKYKRLCRTAAFLIISEAIFLIVYGFFNMKSPYLSILNIFFVCAEIALLWYMTGQQGRKKYFETAKLSIYLWICISVIPVVGCCYKKSPAVLIISIISLVNIISILLKIYKPNENILRIVVRCGTISTILFGMIYLSSNESGSLGNVFALKLAYILLTAVLTGICIYKFFKSEKTGFQILASFLLPSYITALFAGFSQSNGVSDIYVNTLHCKPFFFILAVTLTAVYYFKENQKLRPLIWTVLAVDSLGMLFTGYHQLIHYLSDDKAVVIITIFICAAHTVLDGLILHYSTDFEDTNNQSTITALKIADYFRINLAAVSIAINAVSKLQIANMDLVFMTLLAINIIIIAVKYNRYSHSLDMTVNVCCNILIYISIIDLAQKLDTTGGLAFNYTIRFLFILLLLALYYLTAERLIHSKLVILQAYIGLTLTLIVNAACQGLSSVFEIQYIFSIVTMISALVCIIAGFTFKKKGLRVYGLIVVMLCVIKLVTFDIIQADSLSRVAAFVVGGIVCFIISGIYNKVESKLISSSENTESNTQ